MRKIIDCALGLVFVAALTAAMMLRGGANTHTTVLLYVCLIMLPQLLFIFHVMVHVVRNYRVYRDAVEEEKKQSQLKRPRRKQKPYVLVYFKPLRQLLNAAGIHSTRAGPRMIAAQT